MNNESGEIVECTECFCEYHFDYMYVCKECSKYVCPHCYNEHEESCAEIEEE